MTPQTRELSGYEEGDKIIIGSLKLKKNKYLWVIESDFDIFDTKIVKSNNYVSFNIINNLTNLITNGKITDSFLSIVLDSICVFDRIKIYKCGKIIGECKDCDYVLGETENLSIKTIALILIYLELNLVTITLNEYLIDYQKGIINIVDKYPTSEDISVFEVSELLDGVYSVKSSDEPYSRVSLTVFSNYEDKKKLIKYIEEEGFLPEEHSPKLKLVPTKDKHKKELSDALYKLFGNDFIFIGAFKKIYNIMGVI